MPEAVTLCVYAFDELDAEAQVRALDWYREGGFDYPWYDFVYEDFEAICEVLGVRLKTSTVPLLGGGMRQKPRIFFRGFWSQGDGACFEATYTYRQGSAQAVRRHAPNDLELHRLADALFDVQQRNFYQLRASAVHRGHYYHEYCMAIDVARDSPTYQDFTVDAEEAVKEGLRDLARWLYRRLELEFEYLTSNEVVANTIRSNAYRFTSDGQFYG